MIATYKKVTGNANINAHNKSQENSNATHYRLNPLAIVQRGAIIYLLATKIEQKTDAQLETAEQTEQANETATDNETNRKTNKKANKETVIRMFTLHRFQSVEILNDSVAIIPQSFSLKKYIESGAMGFNEKRFDDLPQKGKNTKVALTFDRQAGLSLLESKLAKKQTVTFNEDDTVTVEATVNLTRQLVWWLRGFGNSLIYAEPKRLWQVVQDELD